MFLPAISPWKPLLGFMRSIAPGGSRAMMEACLSTRVTRRAFARASARRGRESCFPEPPMGPFGEPVDEIVLPAHWSRGLHGNECPVILSASGGSITFAAEDARFTYDRHGLQRVGGLNEPADGAADPV